MYLSMMHVCCLRECCEQCGHDGSARSGGAVGGEEVRTGTALPALLPVAGGRGSGILSLPRHPHLLHAGLSPSLSLSLSLSLSVCVRMCNVLDAEHYPHEVCVLGTPSSCMSVCF